MRCLKSGFKTLRWALCLVFLMSVLGCLGVSVSLSGEEVPAALRATSFLEGLARTQVRDAESGEDRTAIVLRSLGLEPDSAGAQELRTVSLGHVLADLR